MLTLTDDTDGAVSGFTMTVKLWVALRLGVLLSATFTVNRLVVLACETSGRQLTLSMSLSLSLSLSICVSVALVGPLNRLKISVSGGELVSVALAVATKFEPTFTVASLIGASTGGVADGINKSTMV